MLIACVPLLIGLVLTALDPAATVRALGHAEAREGALRQVLNADAAARRSLREAGVVEALVALALDTQAPFEARALALRAAGASGHGSEVDALAPLLTPALERTSAGANASTRARGLALALEAAQALRAAGARAALTPAATAPDPDVRAVALGAAGGPEQLCAGLSDPQPVVRAAAARALGRHEGHADCLVAALKDRAPSVRGAALMAVGEARVASAVGAVRAIAGDARGPTQVRAEALGVLGLLGDLEPARAALDTHLSKGGIVPLALGAVAALAESADTSDLGRLRAAASSKELSVAVRAARALALRGDHESLPAISALRARTGARYAADIDAALERLGAQPSAEPDPADVDDE